MIKYRYIIVHEHKCNCGNEWVHSEVWHRYGDGYIREEGGTVRDTPLKYKLTNSFTHRKCWACSGELMSFDDFQRSGEFIREEDEILDILWDL